jgi:hypothetical protein
MYSEPQNVIARRSRGWALAVLTLVAGVLGASEAWADIQVHIMNCTSDPIEAQSFDAKDSVKEVAYSTKTLKSSGESATLSCAGQGEGFCQVTIAVTDLPLACKPGDGSSAITGSVQFHLDSGKWAVVTGYQQSGSSCKPVVQENLGSAPTSCS